MNKQIFLGSVIFTGVILDVYTFFAFKRAFDSKFVSYAYWSFHVLYYTIFLYGMRYGKDEDFWRKSILISLAVLYIPKAFIAFFLIIEDVGRLLSKGYSSFKREEPSAFPSRRKFVSQLALGIATIPFLGVIYGVLFGKYNFRVIHKTLYFDDLPNEFDGFTITQISDIHSGSFDNKKKIEYAIDLINEQKSDLFLFTGDIVNNLASEMIPWIDTFKKIKAPYGKMAVMGNHDYGLYGRFSKDAEENKRLRKKNREELYDIHKKIGFDLLLNENRQIVKKGQTINVIGVENWGASRYFPKRGNLKKATENIGYKEFNILMSHDPSHFDFKKAHYRSKADQEKAHNEKSVIEFEKKIHLTLSGHTHGAQMGIEIPGLKWSPVKYIYPKWAGLYEEAGRYLYVNRGFGFLAFPGRIGIWPEITVLKLKKRT